MKLRTPQNSHLLSLIRFYLESDRCEPWVMALLISKQGSSYRKVGAAMLVNNSGQHFGLISGGCLESDIVLRAQKVLQQNKSDYVIYDMADEDSLAQKLGGGCQGKIGVAVFEITPAIEEIFREITAREMLGKSSSLTCCFEEHVDRATQFTIELLLEDTKKLSSSNGISAQINIKPRPLLWICGGGVDARPIARLACDLGYNTQVIDHRAAYANQQHFPEHCTTVKSKPLEYVQISSRPPDAAVIVSHQLSTDSQWIVALSEYPITYTGLLGPQNRKERVFDLLPNQQMKQWAQQNVIGPIGLNLGGDGPESVALSIMAQVQSIIHEKSGS